MTSLALPIRIEQRNLGVERTPVDGPLASDPRLLVHSRRDPRGKPLGVSSKARVQKSCPKGDVVAATPRVLFLSCDSGGGHNAVAWSMIDGFNQIAEVDAKILNIYQTRGQQIWPFLSKIRASAHSIWQVIYRATDHNWFIRGVWNQLLPSFMGPLSRAVKETHGQTQPDIVVAVHHASAQCLQPLAQRLRRRPLTVVCITDYDVHANWVADADLYLAGSDLACRKLEAADKRVLRPPMLPCRTPRAVAAKRVETEGDVLRIVMMMGLEGSSRRKATRLIDKVLRLQSDKKVHVDVICGRNANLKARLSEAYQDRNDVHVYGFVADVPERMRRANLALIRLSPNAMTETLAAGTPVIGFDWHIHEAECLNLLHELGAGTGSLDVNEAFGQVKRFVDDEQRRNELYDRAYQASVSASASRLAATFILDHAEMLGRERQRRSN